jgi:hypothetical protein
VQISVPLPSVREPIRRDPAGTLARLRDPGLRRVEPFGLAEHAGIQRTHLGVIEFDDCAGDIFEGIAASLTHLRGTDRTDDEDQESDR